MKPKHIKHLKSILESILSSIAKMKELRKFEMFNRLLLLSIIIYRQTYMGIYGPHMSELEWEATTYKYLSKVNDRSINTSTFMLVKQYIFCGIISV